MVSKSWFLATGLTRGTLAQTTSVIDLFLNTDPDEPGNATYHGSVISAAPEATTYSIMRLPENCTEESWWRGPCSSPGEVPDLTRIYVNGPSTYARNLTEAGAFTWNGGCRVSSKHFDCWRTFFGPSAAHWQEGFETDVYMLETTSSLNVMTITAGLEKIQALSTTTSGAAQTAASVSLGPSETGESVSETSASNSASTLSTTPAASSAMIGTSWSVALAAFCGVVTLVLIL